MIVYYVGLFVSGFLLGVFLRLALEDTFKTK